MDDAVAAAREAFETGQFTTPAERSTMLYKSEPARRISPALPGSFSPRLGDL